MSKKYPSAAKNLEDALNNFNEQRSLIFEKKENPDPGESPDFYIERKDESVVNSISVFLKASRNDDKILFTGHMGSGKSTELNKLASLPEIYNKFFLVKFSVAKTLNILDLEYIDLLISIIGKLLTKFYEENLKLDNVVLNRAKDWILKVNSGLKGDISLYDEKSDLVDGVFSFFKKATSFLAKEILMRNEVRNALKRNITELLELTNAIISGIKNKLPADKEILIIIDDLEKIPDVKKAEEIFTKAGIYLTYPKCKIVYTLPIALYHSLVFKEIANNFNKTFTLKNIKLWDKKSPEKLNPDGKANMSEFIFRRINENLIDKKALDLAIKYSGGVAREMVRIMRDSCLKALEKERGGITVDIVNGVIIELKNEYKRGLQQRHYKVMKSILKGEVPDDDNTLMELFHARVILEYENGETWNDINPIVKQLIS